MSLKIEDCLVGDDIEVLAADRRGKRFTIERIIKDAPLCVRVIEKDYEIGFSISEIRNLSAEKRAAEQRPEWVRELRGAEVLKVEDAFSDGSCYASNKAGEVFYLLRYQWEPATAPAPVEQGEYFECKIVAEGLVANCVSHTEGAYGDFAMIERRAYDKLKAKYDELQAELTQVKAQLGVEVSNHKDTARELAEQRRANDELRKLQPAAKVEQFPNFKPPFFYVYNTGGNAPRYRHATIETARREADRIARLRPGADIFILAPVEHKKVPYGGVSTDVYFDDFPF